MCHSAVVSLRIRLLLLAVLRTLEGRETEGDKGRMKDFLPPLIMLVWHNF